ncbi:hypothetical protein Trydic_g1285 [Trypoxylus dichotomus]
MSRTSRLSTPRFSKLKNHTEVTNIPFPEWVDTDVNQEKWDVRAIKDSKKATASKKLPASRLSTISDLLQMESEFFSDPHTFHLPNSINDVSWKRPKDLYEDVEFVIAKPYIDFTLLREGSIHIMHSQFVRSFLNSISILDYIGMTQPWDIESVNHNFTPNTEGVSWKPWHHVYSLCGAGKGQAHAPKYNPAGKYIVRLHWLGCWRKIYVDDSLPIDENNNVLLPGYKFVKEETVNKIPSGVLNRSIETGDKKSIKSGSSKSSKKSSKSSKSSKTSRIQNFEPPPTKPQIELWPYILSKALMKVACLTWTDKEEVLDFNPISCLTGWICQKVVTLEMHTSDIWDICVSYTPDFKWAEETNARANTGKGDKKGDKKKESNSKEGKKVKKGEIKAPIPEVIDETKVYCLVGSCKSIKSFIKELDIEDIQEEWNQDFLIELSRDKPLIKPEPKPELARWKRFRWLNWAIGKGLWPADDSSTPIKCLKFYNSFKKTDPLIPKGNGKDDNVKKSKKSNKGDEKGSKGSKVSSKRDANGALKIFPLVDQSVWVDFADVEEHINTLHIFFRPSQFLSHVQLSDCRSYDQGKDKFKKTEEKNYCELKWPLSIKESRNEPIYLLMDSLDQKLLVINLCQSGHVDRIMYPLLHIDEPYANAILEDYNWERNRVGPMHVFLRTIGCKSMLLYLPPGRIACKLWIWSNTAYVLNILCNVQLITGSIDNIFEAMNSESLLLGKFAQEVGTSFGNLVQSFGTPTYVDEIRKFYRIFATDLYLSKLEYREVYTEFMDILLKVRRDKNEAFALKVLFMDPNISYTGYKRADLTVYNYSIVEEVTDLRNSESYIEEIKMQEKAAVKIQSIMKFRVFDNDDLQEVPRLASNTKGYFYPPNRAGFTIICYGWTAESLKINWKLYLIYLKGISPGPNVHANVCKCKLKINQSADITLRLSTTGAQAQLQLQVLDSRGYVLAKIQGKQNVILPLIRLKCVNSEEAEASFTTPGNRKSLKTAAKNTSKTKVTKPSSHGASIYYVEVSVLNKTWPLTMQEWLTVKVERNKYLLKPSSALSPRSSLGSASKKRTASVMANSHPVAESPYWTLQVIHDIGENLNVERDLSRQEAINDIKIYWYHNDLERYHKSQQIRQEYLQNLCEKGYRSVDSSRTFVAETPSDIPLNRWIPETMMLKPFDLSEYYFRIEEEPIYLTDLAEWESSLVAKSRDEIKTLAYTISQCQERMDRVENDQIENFIIVRQWYDECRADSAELIKSSYALRDEFIDMVIEENQKLREVNTNAETKKNKKKK